MSEPNRIDDYSEITTHVTDGLALLPRGYLTRPRVQAILSAFLAQAQDLENAFWAVLSATLDTATGDALDQYGRLLKFPRATDDDDTYRAVLRAVVLARRSSGTPEDLIAIMKAALGNDHFIYTEGNASVLIEPTDVATFDPKQLWDVLQIGKEGGVQLQLSAVQYADDTGMFTFSDRPTVESSVTLGFSDTVGTTGGYLIGVIGESHA
jgi:hypothetical protein